MRKLCKRLLGSNGWVIVVVCFMTTFGPNDYTPLHRGVQPVQEVVRDTTRGHAISAGYGMLTLQQLIDINLRLTLLERDAFETKVNIERLENNQDHDFKSLKGNCFR